MSDVHESTPMHPNQVTLTANVVRQIVNEQFPEWRKLPIRSVKSTGTVNQIFRIGDRLAARFPFVVSDPAAEREYLRHEAEAIVELQAGTSFPTPTQISVGVESQHYPWPWAVHSWLPGQPAILKDLSTSSVLADDVGALISEIRAIPVGTRAFSGRGRGGDLREHDEWMEECFTKSETILEVAPLRSLWGEMRELPRTDPDAMTHGDLLAGNLLVRSHRLVGVLDIGNFGPADPALELMGLWSLFDEDRREQMRIRLRCGDLEWARGRAWAFEQAMGAVWYYVKSNPPMAESGLRAIGQILGSST